MNCITIRIQDVLGVTICLLLLLNRSIPIDCSSLWQLGILLILYIILRFIRDKTSNFILYFISFWGVTESIIAILQNFYWLESNHNTFNITGTFGNPGPLGGFLSICLIATISLFYEYLRKQIRFLTLWYAMASICIFYGLILSESRAGWLSFMTGVLFLISIKIQHYSFTKKWYILYKLIILLVICIFITGIYFLKKDSADGRLLIWLNTLSMITIHPILGMGTGGWLANYMHFQADYFVINPNSSFGILADNAVYPYNEFLHITAEYGFLGLAITLLLLYSLFRYQSNEYKDNTIKAILIVFLVFSFFSYPLEVLKLQVVFTIILGLMKSYPIKKIAISAKCFCISVTILIFCVSSITVLSYRTYNQTHSLFIQIIKKKNSTDFELRTLDRLYPYFRYNPYLMDFYTQNCIDNFSVDRQLEILNEVARLNPTSEVYCNMGKLWIQKENYIKAETCYKTAINMIPHRITPKYELFKLYVMQNDSTSAIRIGHLILSQPEKKEGTKTLRMKGNIARYISSHNS